jgi:hypothetical protein
MISTYKVSARFGRWRYFPSLELAKSYAELVYRKTGVFVAIEETHPKKRT